MKAVAGNPRRYAAAFVTIVLIVVLTMMLFGSGDNLRPQPHAARASDRGEILFAAAGCANCHTDRRHKGPLLGGGRALVTAFGIFYTPNISRDPIFGIGRWSDADFIQALRHGTAPDGTDYYPSFPYPAFTQMSDDDILAIKRYIFTLPAQATPNRPHQLRFPFGFRIGVKLWKILYLREGTLKNEPDKSTQWNRGAYLVRAVAHCGECHTPRTWLGGLDSDRRFAGVEAGPDGMKVPDITPDPHALGRWSVDDIASYLDDGMTPDGDSAGGAMAEVVRGTSRLSLADREAIAIYLKSLPPLPPAGNGQGPAGG